MTVDQLAEGIKAGKRRFLAKAITLVESSRDSDQELARKLLAKLNTPSDTFRIGISGVPGVGKSTFIEAFGNFLIDLGHKVAVLAVDPSSPTSGGSILGDKTRMESLAGRDEAFIRPSPTSGTLGGVAKRTRESIQLCEAAGYDIILVETVGVGQSEFEVANMVDCFMVMLLPGAGDSLQGIKRGILEITDILVINKADGEQKKLAQFAQSEYKSALHLLAPKYDGIEVSIQTVSALYKQGIDEVWQTVCNFRTKVEEIGLFQKNRNHQNLNWFKRIVEEAVLSSVWKKKVNVKLAEQLRQKILSKEITPGDAAAEFTKTLEK